MVAAGCKSNTFGTPGIESGERKHGRDGGDIFFLKQLYHARHIRNRLIECFERASNPTLTEAEKDAFTTFIVVGAGPTSCEFTTELSDFVRSREMRKWYPELAARAKLVLVDPGDHVMSVFDATLAEYYEAHLKEIGVDLRLGNSVTGVVRSGGGVEDGDHGATPSVAQLRDGSEVPFGCLVWSAGNKPVRFIENATADASLSSEGEGGEGLRRSHGGRLAVDDFLRVPGTGGRVFAAGDCAAHEEAPLPMTASVAEQQGAYLAKCFNDHYHPHMLGIMADDKVPSSSSSGADAASSSAMVLPPPGPVHPAVMPFSFLEPLDRLFTARSEFRYVERGAMASMGLGRVSKRTISPCHCH